MFLVFEDRPSDSPYVERVWRCHSERAGSFLSVAASHSEMVVTRLQGKVFLTLRGPETRVTTEDCPADGEWIGIRFKLGTFLPQLPVPHRLDRNDVTLPGATARSFWLSGTTWEYPDFENAETFVRRLARSGVVARDPAVEAALQTQTQTLSMRSVQRHFRHTTGMTHGRVRQIERARLATTLLRQGISIHDTVHEADYFDQAHLTRSLRQLIGQTPTQIIEGSSQLSFLYKTAGPR